MGHPAAVCGIKKRKDKATCCLYIKGTHPKFSSLCCHVYFIYTSAGLFDSFSPAL